MASEKTENVRLDGETDVLDTAEVLLARRILNEEASVLDPPKKPRTEVTVVIGEVELTPMKREGDELLYIVLPVPLVVLPMYPRDTAPLASAETKIL